MILSKISGMAEAAASQMAGIAIGRVAQILEERVKLSVASC